MKQKLLFILILVPLLSLFLSGRGRVPANAYFSSSDPPPPAPKGDVDEASASFIYRQSVAGLSFTTSSTLSVDPFGYSWDDTISLAWRDAKTGGTLVNFDSDDDDYTDLIDIGFDFKFYEHTYNQLSISTNGYVAFEGGSSYYLNQPLPKDTPPNNIIAPFWDDLYLGSGTVYYKYYPGSALPCGTPSFVVEWYQVEGYDNPGVYTFELILCQSGDIIFQYQILSGDVDSATVGIEDQDGINGLVYLANEPGLASGKAIIFDRPNPAPRVKMTPPYQSGFAINRKCQFEVSVQNIGELGADTYNLTAASSNPSWAVAFHAADGITPLLDTDHDGQVDTGSVAQGDSTTVTVKVQPPADAALADYTQVTLVATSSSLDTVAVSATLQAAVPAPFAQLYSDQGEAKYNQTWKANSLTSKVDQFYTGTTLALAGINEGNYILAWEKEGITTKYSDVEYLVLDRFGQPITPVNTITDNGNLVGPDLTVKARNPSVEIAPDGRIALAWIQYKKDRSDPNDPKENTNIYLAILEPGGALAFGPVNLTNNNSWRSPSNPNAPKFKDPRITASHDNHYLFAWLEDRIGQELNKLSYAVYTTGGNVVKSPADFAQSTSGSTLIHDPALTKAGERILLAYSIEDKLADTYSVAYGLLDSNGNEVKSSLIPGSSGLGLDVTQFSTGNLLLAWTNPSTGRISYVVLDASGTSIVSGPHDLPLIGFRTPDYVSATVDQFGHAILTWLDAEWNDYIYYAAIDGEGDVVTPPMIFATGSSTDPLLDTSTEGLGNAPYTGALKVLIPMVQR